MSNYQILFREVLRCGCCQETCVVDEEDRVKPLIISSLFFLQKSEIWTANLNTHVIVQDISSCMLFEPFQRLQRLKDTIIKSSNIIREKTCSWTREPVSSSDVFSYLVLDWNHHTQCLLAIIFVLVYMFLKTALIFLGFAVASWKWICKAFFPCWK